MIQFEVIAGLTSGKISADKRNGRKGIYPVCGDL